ncbi:MAG TPA: aminotransferase class I/II-fold pyridoxal phosphate-dependent enzyme [Xanthobacteraceae bacterium]|jgi:aspartate/methionine/tyrosine aminotransferase|nr:aminotransferase class I/II-fold pyridoxal phosphate-dependent enzyme [Xanthobacteraceae bacterium]
MLEKAKGLMQPSLRSGVPPFMVMDVMAAAARLEAKGRHIVHMEVGQPAAGAPATAIAAVRTALSAGPHGYTEALGIASLRRRIARAYAEWRDIEVDAERIVITTGSSAGFTLAFLAAFEAGDRVAVAVPGYPPYRHILAALGCEPVLIETGAATRWAIASDMLLAQHRSRPLKGVIVGSPANPTGTMMTAPALAELIQCAEAAGIAVISDEIYHGLDYAFAAQSAVQLSSDAIVINSFSKYFCMTGWRIGWMVVPPALLRAVERLQQNLAISVPTLSQIAAEAACDGRAELEAIKQGYEVNRRILVEGLPRVGLSSFLPADGAFYLYADISGFAADSFDFATRMLEEAGVAATPGVDFDPINGRKYLRLCYAGTPDDMREAVERIGRWLKG